MLPHSHSLSVSCYSIPTAIQRLSPYRIEENLVAGLIDRQEEALEFLYDHYSGALYGVMMRIVRNEAIAQELLQDLFVKVWNKIDTYDRTKGRLYTWMLNIARHLAIDKARSKEFTQRSKTDDLQNLVHAIDRTDFTEVAVDSIGIRELLDRLPEEQRLVVDYLYLRGYTQSELAEECNIPLGTVKTRLRMAMITLRSILLVN